MKHPSRANIVLIGFLAIGGFLLVMEHRAHLVWLVPFLPWLLLLACPLMHVFMHHGGHGEHEEHGSDAADRGRNSLRYQR
jgi:hypothetical protein